MGNHLNFFYLLIFALCPKMRSILEIIRWAADKNVFISQLPGESLAFLSILEFINAPFEPSLLMLAVCWNHLLWFRAQRKGAPQVCAEPNPLPSSISHAGEQNPTNIEGRALCFTLQEKLGQRWGKKGRKDCKDLKAYIFERQEFE